MFFTTTWAILGASCVCLLLVNANVDAGDKMQPRHDIQDRKPPRPRNLSSRRLEIKRMKMNPTLEYPFPIVRKGGVSYYDLAEVEDTIILKNNQSVEGITASKGECRLRFLHLGITYQIDEDLITNCPLLNLTLEGNLWRCLQEGRMLQRGGVAVDMSLALCTDVWQDNSTAESQEITEQYWKYRMKEGVQKLDEFGITNCSAERCSCKWYFKKNSYAVNVDCEGVGLTDDKLPTLPMYTKDLRMEKNALRSMDRLVKHLMPHNQTLLVLHLDDNQMEQLPHFPDGTFPHMVALSMPRNKIRKVNIDVFRDLITRKKLVIHLKGNNFTCDCDLYEFQVFLRYNYMRHWGALKSILKTQCQYKHLNKTEPIYALTEDLCRSVLDMRHINWWIVLDCTLGFLNIITICMMIDLISIIANTRRKDRRPVMDRLIAVLKCSKVCFKRSADGNLDDAYGSVFGFNY